MSDILCFHIHLVNAVVSVIDVVGSNVIWRYHRTELRSSQSDSKYGHEGLYENAWYVLCHIYLVNAVISVIYVESSNEVWRYHRSEV
jgi:predicted metal-dependent enzyme (double-stranded beta helix superfamily)